MTFLAEELASQLDSWARAENLTDERAALPAHGTRVAIVGCGTSWFIAQSYAALREQRGHGETDAFVASEAPMARNSDTVIALTRSGTTTEVLRLADHLGRRGRPHGSSPGT